MKTREEAFYTWLYELNPEDARALHEAWKAGWSVAHNQIKEALKKYVNTDGVVMSVALLELQDAVRWAEL